MMKRSYRWSNTYRESARDFLTVCYSVKGTFFASKKALSIAAWIAGIRLPKEPPNAFIDCTEIRRILEDAARVALVRRLERPCNYAFPDTCPRPLPVLGQFQ